MLATRHPNYSPEMELLASVPREPEAVSLRDLASDMGCAQAEVRLLFPKLRDMHVNIVSTEKKGRGHCVSIARKSWIDAARIADAYLDSIDE